MGHLFHYATSFNSDLSSWNVSNVASTRSMFIGATNFTSDLSSWDVSAVTDMTDMFSGASNFLQTCQVGMYRTLQEWLQCLTKHRTLQEMFLTGMYQMLLE